MILYENTEMYGGQKNNRRGKNVGRQMKIDFTK